MNTYRVKYIPRNEVKKHRSKSDLWIIIENTVYDVSGYRDHPGGKEIFMPFAGNYHLFVNIRKHCLVRDYESACSDLYKSIIMLIRILLGKDASAAFSKFSHGQYALLEMQKYMLGPLVDVDAKPVLSTSAHENTLSSLDPPSISLRSIWSRLALPLAIIAVVGAIKRVTGID